MKNKAFLLIICLGVSLGCNQMRGKVELGDLKAGSSLDFIRSADGEWEIEISGVENSIHFRSEPAKLEIYVAEEEIHQFAAGYKTIKKSKSGIDAEAEIAYGDNVVFRFLDHWQLDSGIVTLKRQLALSGNAPGSFNTSLVFEADTTVVWTDFNFLAPGALYGDPTFDGERSPGGTLNYAARRFLMREDILPAPLFALLLENGTSIALLNPSPRGESTVDETKLVKDVMTDERIQFGTLGAWQDEGSPVEFGYFFPSKTVINQGGQNSQVRQRWIRRYHPIDEGIDHSYELSIRIGQKESFTDVTKNAWRWAWNTLDPAVAYTDIEQMRQILADHLLAQAATIDGRTAMPFVLSSVNDVLQWNWTMVAMGFVGKDIECADQLLRESYRDKTERGEKMRQTGLNIISSLIKALPDVPLQGTGFNLATGKPWDHIWLAPWLRNATEDMRVLVGAYRRERTLGYEHPEWFAWVKQYIDWLVLQQREDGSFPRRWLPGTNEVAEPTGTTSYSPVPLLIMMTEETGDPKYMEAATRAAEYTWESWGKRGLFIGGASDNPNITDKEAGMLSMEAYLSLYDATRKPEWLERARAAADFTETWIWIWDLPMPIDAVDSLLHYKKEVSTIGVQGITAQVAGSVDEYLDWSVPSYARLYKYTMDEHYLDVARILLHNTKSMVAIPGRMYDYKGIGWQQEGWRFGPGGTGRGVGGHRFWLPWVSSNHLHGINGLEELDRDLYQQLIKEKL